MKCFTDDEIAAMTQQPTDAAQLLAAAQALVAHAARLGLVLTVEQEPLQPLAMGHYSTMVSVRNARPTA